jgi:hypothetical protein
LPEGLKQLSPEHKLEAIYTLASLHIKIGVSVNVDKNNHYKMGRDIYGKKIVGEIEFLFGFGNCLHYL